MLRHPIHDGRIYGTQRTVRLAGSYAKTWRTTGTAQIQRMPFNWSPSELDQVLMDLAVLRKAEVLF